MATTRIVGQSAWTRSLRERIELVAKFSSSVLITGPSGTGKELVARSIHDLSPRADRPFIAVDCTALTGELVASHLFGHVKGAFTGAEHERIGCFRAADSGTILLDEIGELSADLQSKLLRAIQERVVVPLGGERPIPVDVRIIAATNRNLSEEVRAGRFRLDLFYRLNVISLETLALAQRPSEIEPLAAYFLEKLRRDHGLPRKRFSPSAILALQAYSWPGNVRELQNVVERAVIFAKGDVIEPEELPFDGPPASHAASTTGVTALEPSPPQLATRPDVRWSTLADIEREHIRATLARTFNNRTAAAELLGIDRSSLARKIQHFGISISVPRRGRPRKDMF